MGYNELDYLRLCAFVEIRDAEFDIVRKEILVTRNNAVEFSESLYSVRAFFYEKFHHRLTIEIHN